MKILRLQSENIKRISVVDITPDGNLIQIAGKNGNGKTSVLDSILYALGGANSIPMKPVREGCERGRIEIKLGDGQSAALIIERTFTESNSYLSVKTEDGAKYPKPQRILDDMLGALTFDPLQFMRSDAKAQFETLRGIVDLPIDLDDVDRMRAEAFEARTEKNRQIKALKAQIDVIVPPENVPDEKIDTNAIIERLARVDEHNSEVRQAQKLVANAEHAVETCRRNVERIEAELKAAKSQLSTAESAYSLIKDKPIAELVDPQKIKNDLAAAEEQNRAFDIAARIKKMLAQHDALENEAHALTDRITEIDQLKSDALEAAEMPVAGLSFGDGVVTLNGIPINQASDAEQLKISTAIAAALNPKLRIIRIRDGSLLDDDSMKWLADFADERDMQIWVEIVGERPGAIIMEDGHVRGQTPHEEADANEGAADDQG